MGHRTAAEGHRVLICAPYGRDAESLRKVLADQGYDAACFAGLDDLAEAVDDRAGVALLTAESLRGDVSRLRRALAAQPPWSELPFIALAAMQGGSWGMGEAARAALVEIGGNPIVLERPIGSASLTSACAAAMRSRQKQFDMRDRLRDLEEERASLESKVHERTAALTAEMRSRSRAEEALRQSQKMEAIGQLTGGIAHDFNNMLTGVIGSLDIMRRRMEAGRMDGLERFMDTATGAARRAAALTARLLAFSRRQSLDSRPLDAGALLASLEELLRRTIPANIELRILAGEGLPPAIADANQLENAILNLAINARDAMPDGGQLTIEAKLAELDAAYAEARPDVQPGRYVAVSVSDTGVGMPQEILAKAFDPFFTTKPVGEGTGLGLSSVHGFAKQSGGQARIHSTPGIGTAVTIFLPAGGATEPAAPPIPASAPEGSGERVLLVEDDAGVRQFARDVLDELSYSTLEAADADQAIRHLRSDARIDLLITDVGLPGMNGRQLAEVARERRPGLPILFITGYAENAAIRAGFLGTNMGMLPKPFAVEALASKVAEMLARRGPASD